MRISILGLTLILWSSFTWAAGFSQVEEIRHTELKGTVHLRCSDGVQIDYQIMTCYGAEVIPGTHDFFVMNDDVDADKVRLTVNWPNGKTVTKTKNYDSEKRTSKRTFNLWAASLFQRPLLHFGTNQIQYELLKDNQVVAKGVFQVKAFDEGVRQCRYRSMDSFTMSDCQGGGSSFVCSDYFTLENNCQY